jgi:multidrug efflux pump subunit AcrB
VQNFYRVLISNTVFTNVILVLIVLLGAFAVGAITKESQPEMEIPIYSVTVIYPGADPEEVEEGVTRKIEAKLDGMRGVKEFTSISREGSSVIQVEIVDGIDFAEAGQRIRTAVDSINTFPEDIEKPQVQRATSDEEVKGLVIWGDIPERQMK